MRRCKAEGCTRHIQPESKTGLCLTHFAEARFAAAKPVPVCKACGRNALTDKSKTGLCLPCYRAEHIHVRRCDCGAAISRHNKTGNCQDCYYAAQGYPLRTCVHPDCSARIQKSNRSGLCRAHKHQLRKPVPNDAAVTLARQVGEALGVDHREIFGRRQDGVIVEARAIVAQKLRERGLSWNRIGLRLGRDHSSVINLTCRLPEYAARNPRVAAYLERAA